METQGMIKTLIFSSKKSYRLEPTVKDHGAARMDFLKQRKLESFTHIAKCRTDPTCSDVFMRDNEGFVACVDGKKK